ncbi:MAG: hypothetical protein IPI43_05050 [Sandaracinaceae bacterium]|nr:hypothetical protein [Sandaracinaceae bacterium]
MSAEARPRTVSSTKVSALPLLLLLALGACGGEPRDEGAGSTAESAAPPAVEGARAEEPSGAPGTTAATDARDDEATADADLDGEETLGRVVTRGGVVEVGLSFEGACVACWSAWANPSRRAACWPRWRCPD